MDSQSFSRELAKALIESEDKNERDSSAAVAYQRLCFDDPLPVSPSGCLALQKALIDDKCYALSHRLIEGIQCCAMRSVSTSEASLSSSFLLSTEASNDAYAQLAWTVHAYIPLQCLRCTDIQQVARYLGTLLEDEVESRRIDVKDAPLHDPPRTYSGRERPTTASSIIHDEKEEKEVDEIDSLEEVFAAESDGSDFEFDSGYDDTDTLRQNELWATRVQAAADPLTLSRPPTEPTWNAVARAVSDLLQSLRHSLLSSLSLAQWKQLRLSEHMTQLVLSCMIPSKSSSPIFKERPDHHWQTLGLQVLHVFRDGAVESSSSSIMDGFLQLIRIMLQVDAASSQSSTSAVSPATLAGLGSLAALATECSDPQVVPRLRSTVLDACDDLAGVLEKAASSSDPTLHWTFASLFSLFTNNPTSLPTPAAQLLLNSGLFQQWLLQWSQTTRTTANTASHTCVQTSLWKLCTAHPNLLGKYAWRFPQFAMTVTQAEGMMRLPWYLLGMHVLVGSSSSSSTVQWRSKATTAPTSSLTLETCRESVWNLFREACAKSLHVVEEWREENHGDTTTAHREHCATLNELVKLAAVCDSYSFLRQSFLQAAPSTDAIRKEIQPLQQQLSQAWPSTRRPSSPTIRNDEDDDPTSKPKSAFSERVQAINGLRRSVKTLAFLAEATETVNHKGSVSSKVD